MLLKFTTLFVLAFTACARIAPASPDPNDVAPSELTGDFFHGAVPTRGPGVATGPIVSPDGSVFDSTNVSLAVAVGDTPPELRVTMGMER